MDTEHPSPDSGAAAADLADLEVVEGEVEVEPAVAPSTEALTRLEAELAELEADLAELEAAADDGASA